MTCRAHTACRLFYDTYPELASNLKGFTVGSKHLGWNTGGGSFDPTGHGFKAICIDKYTFYVDEVGEEEYVTYPGA